MAKKKAKFRAIKAVKKAVKEAIKKGVSGEEIEQAAVSEISKGSEVEHRTITREPVKVVSTEAAVKSQAVKMVNLYSSLD